MPPKPIKYWWYTWFKPYPATPRLDSNGLPETMQRMLHCPRYLNLINYRKHWYQSHFMVSYLVFMVFQWFFNGIFTWLMVFLFIPVMLIASAVLAYSTWRMGRFAQFIYHEDIENHLRMISREEKPTHDMEIFTRAWESGTNMHRLVSELYLLRKNNG